MYIASASMGKYLRSDKFQMVEYSLSQKKRSNLEIDRCIYPRVLDLVCSINQQLDEYTELRKVILKYQSLAKSKKSILLETI